jgi:hypothetical protein
MPEFRIGRAPFSEAVEFFKKKTAWPSEAYTDLLHEMHERAFVIAGVTDTNVACDVRSLIIDAMENGTPYAQWQKNFEKTIDGRWLPFDRRTGEVNAGWRGRVIYQTNMRTAYAAGRYQQLQRMKDSFPYWRYCHGNSREPRPEHLSWHGMILKADSPWWDTHYPPNGWGCSCYVEPVSATEMEGLKKAGKARLDDAPPVETEKAEYGGRTLDVPKGIDPGWAYAPGAGGTQGLLRSLAQGYPSLTAKGWERVKDVALKEAAAEFRAKASKIIGVINQKLTGQALGQAMRGLTSGEAWVVGFLDDDLLAGMAAKAAEAAEHGKEWGKNFQISSAGIEVIDTDIFHGMRDLHVSEGIGVPIDSYLNMPKILAKPKAVLCSKENGALLYVFDVGDPDKRGVFVVQRGIEAEAATRTKKKKRVLNKVRTATLQKAGALSKSNYYFLRGAP